MSEIKQYPKQNGSPWVHGVYPEERHVHCRHDGDELCCSRCMSDPALWQATFQTGTADARFSDRPE